MPEPNDYPLGVPVAVRAGKIPVEGHVLEDN
jgi:hypothetical protein